MAKPKNPNPGPGAAARRAIGLNTAAEKLRAAGWIVAEPGVAGAAEALVAAVAELSRHMSGSDLAAMGPARAAVEQFRTVPTWEETA